MSSSITLPQLLELYKHSPSLQALHQALSSGHSPIALTGLRGSASALMLAALSQRCSRTYLIVLDDEESAGYFYHDLSQLLGVEQVAILPSSYRRAVKYGQRDAANEILRTDVFARLSQRPSTTGEAPTPSSPLPSLCIVTHPAALAERVASRQQLDEQSLTLHQGEEHDVTQLAQRLESLGFVRRDYVYEPGEFAQRGSIVDVFSYASEYPYRLDFFGDELESIRTFEVQSQLSRALCQEVRIVPDIEGTASSETSLVGFDTLLPDDSVLVCRHLPFIGERVQAIYDEGFARQAIAERQATSEMDEAEAFARFTSSHLLMRGDQLLRGLTRLARLELGDQRNSIAAATVTFQTQAQPLFHKNFEQVLATLQAHRGAGLKTYVLADSDKQNERLRDILGELQAKLSGEATATSVPTLFTPIHGTLHEGFVDEQAGLAFYTDHQIFDRFHKYNLRSDHARNAKIALTLKELMLFEPGDFVVHVDHGVGKFAGLVRIPGADGEMQEVIKITYHNNDAIFVSIHALHKVSKYKGKEGAPPRLSHLGTGAWERIKHKTKEKLKDIARDLILLYSRRREEQGFAYSPDSFLQHELEASFAYEDTPDQLLVTQQVKADMERPRPMDRLVCGDVGFGKTEIAVRAAFKAACDGKQVAVLVPTTVLALQHFKTFQKRLKGFPVEVDYLSRARTAAQTKALLKRLESGALNILIGTHKLIGKSVKFHDLGLLIIDEEQKFGVSVKEKLRQLKVNVDTLTMSATPIPRTLQFSLMGARDLSVINTPPPNRHPIQTEIHSFGHEILADAINFELSRNGQVYIVTHRISSLSQIENLIHRHVPDARVVVGHGQMEPKKLEQIILDFVNHEFDVLLSTTIIENGIDVPNANTILIDNAHHFGLSDLHQMRGRVGRGGRKAFCYLMAPPLALLPDESRRRLQAIENFSDLGSGIHIAMQDLDIRGAGNLLGAEQSGFIADLGYETYQKILAEAVAELKNDEFAELFAEELEQQSLSMAGDAFVAECNVECDLRAYLPEVYVPGASERMLLYRELDGLNNETQIADFRRRLADRFGPLPPEAEELLRVVPLRRLGRHYGAERLVLKGGTMTLYFVANADSPFYRSTAFSSLLEFSSRAANVRRCALGEQKGKRYLRIKSVGSVEQALKVLESIAPAS
ncbi:MAG: transcription-repair coupling factor [Bacteroidales bacterium]|nr:transcription-repair coupling factor [Bacteroidales bacterium]